MYKHILLLDEDRSPPFAFPLLSSRPSPISSPALVVVVLGIFVPYPLFPTPPPLPLPLQLLYNCQLSLPAGYMEMGESAAEGAVRETWEEAGAEVHVISPFAQLDIPLIGQTYVIFLAKLKKPNFSPGPESSECQFFAYDDVPFDSLAFSSMLVTLNLYIEDMKNGSPKFHYGTINKRPGTRPSDIHAYTLGYHLQTSS